MYENLVKSLEDASKDFHGKTLSCIPSIPDSRDFIFSSYFDIPTAEVPVTIDYRPNLPPVFDQGQRGSCVPSTLSWTIKASQEINQGDFPEEGLSVAYLYALCKQNDGIPNIEGTYLKTAMQMLRQYGICPEINMPYFMLTNLTAPSIPTIPSLAISTAGKYKISNYAQICAATDYNRINTLNIIRQALKSGPFAIAILIYDNFIPDENNVLPLPSGNLRGAHAVGIAGDLPDRQCLILRNSWGRYWGDNGYAYLPYEWISSNINNNFSLVEGWTAIDITASNDSKVMEVVPNNNTIKVDGVNIFIDAPTVVINGRIYVPIRSLASNMGRSVFWDGTKAILTKQV